MIKIAFASGFVAGALVMSIFFGNQTLIFVQAASGPGPVAVNPGPQFVPALPPLQNRWLGPALEFRDSAVVLDGLQCDKCQFAGDVKLIYSGGLFELKDAAFSSPTINVELRGAALNTFILLRYLERLKASPAPEKFPWQDPKWSINVKEKMQMDMVTPIRK